jgi:uncharacterized protein
MIKNKTQNKIIIKNKKLADTFLKKAIGLMFRFKEIDFGLIFDMKYESKERVTLHMFFVFFKINVLFLNEDKKVVDKKKDFKPFSMYTPKKKARYVIELPKKINVDLIKIKDKIEW